MFIVFLPFQKKRFLRMFFFEKKNQKTFINLALYHDRRFGRAWSIVRPG